MTDRIESFGQYSVAKRERVQASPKNGLRQDWTEYQVRCGRKIIARHEVLRDALADARQRHDDDWSALAEHVKGVGAA